MLLTVIDRKPVLVLIPQHPKHGVYQESTGARTIVLFKLFLLGVG